MPTIYTKEEIDKMFAELRDLIKKMDSTTAKCLEGIKGYLETEHNENFSNYNECINRLNKIDQDFKAKEKQAKEVKSPYAR